MLLIRILYWRFRLWLLRKGADIRNVIGGYLLRFSARAGSHWRAAHEGTMKLLRALAAVLVLRLARLCAEMGNRIISQRAVGNIFDT